MSAPEDPKVWDVRQDDPPHLGICVRDMQKEDVSAVHGLEQACFSDAWSERILDEMLGNGMDLCFVLEVEKQEKQEKQGEQKQKALLGYVNIRILGEEAELMRICVLPSARGRGMSRLLLARALTEMGSRGARAATLEVRAGNAPAKQLYQSHGFVLEGVRKNYYRDPIEDAEIYWNRNI